MEAEAVATPAVDFAPPPGPLPSYPGVIDLYQASKTHRYPLFKSGDVDSETALIFYGGLFDGMLTVGYASNLHELTKELGWTLVQPHWSGAYDGFGTTTLDNDILEIEAVVKHLRTQGKKKIFYMGHSTGSQFGIHYLLSPSFSSSPIEGAILQAPVSDREYFITFPNPEAPALVALAKEMVEKGEGHKLMPEGAEKIMSCKITAERFWSLLSVGGTDDYFSSDLPEQPSPPHRSLSETFGRLPSTCPVLLLYSGADEATPASVDKIKLLQRFKKATDAGEGKLDWKIIEGAGHQVRDEDHRKVLVGHVRKFLTSI